jgi:hypothetical protein
LRSRDIVTVVPRSGETAIAAGLATEGAETVAATGAEYVGVTAFNVGKINS